MLKLILHHTYKFMGEALDLSRHDNHGFRYDTPYLPDGRSPNTGALDFNGTSSGVRVPLNPTWLELGALQIEVWVRLRSLGRRRNLVEGDSSFAFFIHPDGLLWGTYYDVRSDAWVGAHTEPPFTPGGGRITVPLGVWTKLTYFHDGFSTIRLFMNDTLVAVNNNLRAPIISVGGTGVSIGRWPGDGRYTFDGVIDDVKIWKYDPDLPLEQLFSRKLDPDQRDCWRKVLERLGAYTKDEPRGDLTEFIRCVAHLMEEMLRRILSQSEETGAWARTLGERYLKLWFENQIAGDDMRALMADWRKFFERTLGGGFTGEWQQWFGTCGQRIEEGVFIKITEGLAECDPAFAGYLKIIYETFLV